MNRLIKACLTAAAIGVAGMPGLAQERPNTILVLDASGSMWGQIDGVNKITIARDVVAEILSDFPSDQNLGFVTYGHRERGECSDIELMVPPAPGTAGQIAGIVAELNPRGMTPMADSVIAAAEALRYTENAATVILVSDGIETCNPDPCAAAAAMAEAGIDFTAHVIGFDVADEAEALLQMQCMAEATGGSFHTADNAAELLEALQEVVAAPPMVTLTLSAHLGEPALADAVWHLGSAGSDLPLVDGPVIWSILDPVSDPLLLETEGNPLTVEVPTGDYSVTAYYMVREQLAIGEVTLADAGDMTLIAEFPGAAPEKPVLEPIAEGILHAPVQAIVGAEFPVTWDAVDLHPRDYITIVPAGADDGEYGTFDRVADRSEGKLRAPAWPGLYEVRLQTNGENDVIARTPIEIIDTPVSVSTLGQVVVGSSFRVTWTAEGLHPRDYVTIVPTGAEEGSYGDYTRIGDESQGNLRAPATPGAYEVRLQMEGSGRVLASTPVEVVDVPVTVSAPEQAISGTHFRVTWTAEGLHPRDYVTIVPTGAEEGSYGDYTRIGDESQGDLRAPAEPGAYEVRLQMEGSGRVLATTPIEVVDVPVTVSAPAQAVLGSSFRVTWTAEGLNPRDYVTIVAMGAEEGSYTDYTRIGDESQGDLRAPAQTGFYEVRLQMEGSGRVLASTPIEITAADVSVSGPDRVRAGDQMTIAWTGTIHPRDYITVVPADAADDAYADYFRVGDNAQDRLRAPEAPGNYELRYVLEGTNGVMARQVVEVLAADAPLDEGAGLVVPATASPGQTITVTWSGGSDSADQRVTLARADQADFTWITVESAIGRNSLKMTIPDEPGTYEVRYLDIPAGAVLGRAIIVVQ